MSAFTVCALAALGFILTVAAIQVAAEDRRERRRGWSRCSCRRYVLTEARPSVIGFDVIHEMWRCQPRREEVR